MLSTCSPNLPTGPIWSRSPNVCPYSAGFVCILYSPHAIFFKASCWPSDHMIRSQPLIGLSELCFLDENSEDLQSHDGLLDENAEEVHNLHHNLQSHDGLPDKNAKEVNYLHHNLQSPDGLLDENSEEVHNLQSPDEKMCS